MLARLSAIRAARAAGRRSASGGRRVRAAARLAGAVLAAAGLCAVTVIPAQADAVRDQEMWVLDMVHAPSAWPVTQGQGVLVAVIDSGVSPSVSDLAGSVTEGPNLSGVNTPPSNASWGVHGTWMASLIAGHGHGDGSSGIEGVAPQSRVLSIRVVTDRGDPNFGKYEQESNAQVQRALARAITVATRRGADVISMSLGYGAASRPVRVALQNALDHGVVVVASSGNSGDTASALSTGQAPYSFPADYPGVLGVGRGHPDRVGSQFLQQQPVGRDRRARRQGTGSRQGRAVLAGQRDKPGMRADSGRGRPHQIALPPSLPGAGGPGHHLHRPEPTAAGLRRPGRVRHGRRGRGAHGRRHPDPRRDHGPRGEGGHTLRWRGGCRATGARRATGHRAADPLRGAGAGLPGHRSGRGDAPYPPVTGCGPGRRVVAGQRAMAGQRGLGKQRSVAGQRRLQAGAGATRPGQGNGAWDGDGGLGKATGPGKATEPGGATGAGAATGHGRTASPGPPSQAGGRRRPARSRRLRPHRLHRSRRTCRRASYPPDPPQRDLPPAQPPPADPGSPGAAWPPPGP